MSSSILERNECQAHPHLSNPHSNWSTLIEKSNSRGVGGCGAAQSSDNQMALVPS